MTTTNQGSDDHEAFRRKVINDRISSAARREKDAEMEKHRAMADLAALDGREDDREFHEAYVAAQTGQPGGHARFWAFCTARDARDVFSGKRTLDEFVSWERPGIAAALERLRAAQDDLMADRPSHETAVPEIDS